MEEQFVHDVAFIEHDEIFASAKESREKKGNKEKKRKRERERERVNLKS